MVSIKVVKRCNDFWAGIRDKPACWGAGKNVYEAIGDLISHHPEYFDVEIIYEYS